MQKFNYKYWLSTAAGIALTFGLILAQAGDQGLVDKDSKHYKWLLLIVGSGGVVNLLLTGASKSRPWLPEEHTEPAPSDPPTP